jgi:integrase
MASYSRRNKNGKPYGPWLIRYKDETGKWKTVAGFTDKERTRTKALDLETRALHKKMGLVDQFEAPKKVSLADHLAAFERHLEAKGDCDDHVARMKARIQAIFDGGKFGSITSLGAHDAADRVNKYLAGRTDLSDSTKNHYRTALIGFCRWAEDGRMPPTPLAHLKKVCITESTREQRAIAAEELDKLFAAARAGKRSHLLSGEERFWLYWLAIESGLRAGELASLTPMNFQGDVVIIRATISKNRKLTQQPLRRDFLDELRPWVELHDTDQRLWPGKWFRRAAEMLRVDLETAGIPFETDKGICDFHSLRAVYVSGLAAAGVDIKSLQTLARHSTPVLTMNVYAKSHSETLAAAVEKLPGRAASAAHAQQTSDKLGQ